MHKRVIKSYPGAPGRDGAGVNLKRVFGYREVPELDPFLLLDYFDSRDPDDYIRGFPWHPHRGIETVTYLIQGRIEHGDSLGNKGIIEDGCCQWMTAGSGIIHQELPKAVPWMRGLQLWINLPANYKFTAPAYRDLLPGQLPVVESGSAAVRILCGEYNGVNGPVRAAYVVPRFFDITIRANGVFGLELPPGHTVIALTISGSGQLDDQGTLSGPPGSAAAFSREEPELRLQAGPDGFRFLLLSAEPLREPVAWGGPIVMNTKEELEEAFREIDAGTFIRR